MNSTDLLFDIVVCVGPHDNDIVSDVLPYTKRNVIGYRNIYLVCSNPNILVPGTITIDEKIFPFTISDLQIMFGNNDRNGWYLQQLLKFYSGNVIPGILKRYLVIDCDTYFLKPTKFITDDGKHLCTTGSHNHSPYFLHMNRLHPSLKKTNPLSGIAHHCFFHTDMVNELMQLIEKSVSNKAAFWQIFLQNIDMNEFAGSGASEYEIYFTFMNLYHSNDMVIRQLNWENVSTLDINNAKDCDFVSVHWYARK